MLSILIRSSRVDPFAVCAAVIALSNVDVDFIEILSSLDLRLGERVGLYYLS